MLLEGSWSILRWFYGPERPVCPNLAKFGSYLATIWPNLVMNFFLVELGKKLRRCVGLVLRVALTKNELLDLEIIKNAQKLADCQVQ